MRQAYLLAEVGLVVLAAQIGNGIASRFNVIPASIIRLPSPSLSDRDFFLTWIVFLIVHFIIFLCMYFLAGGGVFQNARRTAVEIYALIIAVTLSSLILFLFFQTPYSPNLLLAIALTTFVLFVIMLLVGAALFPALGESRNPVQVLLHLAGHGLRLTIKPLGLLTLMFAGIPIVLAMAFVADRDFANNITRIRMIFSPNPDMEWTLVNAFPGTQFLRPIQLQFPPDGSAILYVLERDGALYRFPYTPGSKIEDNERIKLLDLKEELGVVEIENGALGFDHHPEFGQLGSPNSDFIYVYYTEAKEGRQTNYLSRFDVSLSSLEDRMASKTQLIAVERNASGFHNGGSVEFGPDGYLYLAIGEATDRAGHQRLDRSLFGGILRIDVDMRGGDHSHPIRRQPRSGKTNNYFIPNDNPFRDVPDALEEFWAIGLRNPFRMSFDPETGEIWVGEVGSDVWEEVNRIQKGGNYQFPFIEGYETQRTVKPDAVIGKEYTPIYTYRHTAFDRSVLGGVVYRGTKHPDLRGRYIFADNYSGKVMAIDAKASRVDDVVLLARSENFVAQRGITSIAQAPDGKILLTVLGHAGEPTGQILSLVPVEEADRAVQGDQLVTRGNIVPADPAEMFVSDCSRCHGRHGTGDGPDAPKLLETYGLKSLPDFSLPAYHNTRSDAEISRIIKHGGPTLGLSAGMPSWEGIYGDAEIEALVRYVRSLKQ